MHTYKEIELLKEKKKNGEKTNLVIVSYNEKLGIQAIGNKHPDLIVSPDKYPTISRDYEYVIVENSIKNPLEKGFIVKDRIKL